MATFWHILNGPRLFRIFRSENKAGWDYQPNTLESAGNKFITTLRFCWGLSYWTSPFILGILYRRGYFTTDGLASLGRFIAYASTIYFTAIVMRGIGRWMNCDYVTFISVLMTAQKSFTQQNMRLLSQYDFEFFAWPIDWTWLEANISEAKKVKQQVPSYLKAESERFSLFSLPSDVFSYLAIHTFGRRMTYPGTTALINALVEPQLIMGRTNLVEQKKGQRAKLLTEDKNEIDTMFIDRRHSTNTKGKTLVICCEGNAGFYEIGAMGTPIDLGYSVLGWNHPGFAGSTGVPFPSQEQNAIDSVMQYSIHKLGFTPDNIIMYAWSIGGYPATWAAMNYPDIKAVILDATFDDLLPLAIPRMPASFESLVVKTVKRYLNLNNTEQICRYLGPVLLIRRSKDEMITTKKLITDNLVQHGFPIPQGMSLTHDSNGSILPEECNKLIEYATDLGLVPKAADPTAIETNRGNFLLVHLLQHRYPKIVDNSTLPVLQQWLARDKSAQELLWSEYDVDPNWCEVAVKSYVEENSEMFPMEIGSDYTQEQKNQMTLFLASRHMEDFDSTHCTPLPGSLFKMPWKPS